MELPIETSLDKLWEATQNPAEHVRWDLRFTDIQYKEKKHPEDPTLFSYETRLGFGIKISGEGKSIGQKEGRTSALHFYTDDWKSLILAGKGSWAYLPQEKGILFRTVYNYTPRYGFLGRWIDRLMFRPVMKWATAWSFDRLRLWLEKGTSPALSFLLWAIFVICRVALGFVWIWEGLVPKILFPSAEELTLVERTGLAWWEVSSFIPFLGMCEIILGLMIVVGIFPRLLAFLSLIMLLFFSLTLPWFEPSLLYHPFGAITKNMGLIACSLVIFSLAKWVPRASRCNTKQDRSIIRESNI